MIVLINIIHIINLLQLDVILTTLISPILCNFHTLKFHTFFPLRIICMHIISIKYISTFIWLKITILYFVEYNYNSIIFVWTNVAIYHPAKIIIIFKRIVLKWTQYIYQSRECVYIITYDTICKCDVNRSRWIFTPKSSRVS